MQAIDDTSTMFDDLLDGSANFDHNIRVVDPYAGLNRQQRRKAIASERRAFKKRRRAERR